MRTLGPVPAPTVVAALASALRDDPGRPLVTFYDGATGERIELSVKTFDNWVSKIANLLTDELMLDPGETIDVQLPPHWQSTVLLVAAWTAGLHVSLTGAGDAALTVVGPDALLRADRLHGQVVVCSLRPMGGPVLEPLPAGWLDFAAEVPPQPDALLNPSTVGADDVATLGLTGPTTHAELVAQGLAEAAELGLTKGGRLITDANPARPSGLVPALVAPIVADAAVVIVANTDATARAAIADQERARSTHWSNG